jgi:hypothetical protein
VFAASFLLVFVSFVVGQLAAWSYLRTGRFLPGFVATVLLWSLLDWWLVARFVFAVDLAELRWPAAALQAVAVTTAAVLLFGRWRRRWSAAARQRTERFGAGMSQYLRGDYAAARTTFAGLVRTDPWDAAAWIGLGDVHARTGQLRRARRCYRRASGVDTSGEHTELLQKLRLPALARARAGTRVLTGQ